MQSVEEELVHIEDYVEQALFYARSNTVEKDYIVKRILVKDIVSSVIKRNAKRLIEGKVSIVMNDLDAVVFTDPKWVEFILHQIVSNAVKYRSKKSSSLSFSVLEGENELHLRISDNGIGIPAQDISKVFDKGFTGANGRRYAKSTGLGLYLCRKLCRKLGLKIRLSSQVGTGTTVEVIFPKSEMFLMEHETRLEMER